MSDDNFITLGGDSIKVIKLVSELKRQGYSINIGDVFIYAIAEQLSGRIFKEADDNDILMHNRMNKLLNIDGIDNSYVNYVFNSNNYEQIIDGIKYWNEVNKVPFLSLLHNKNYELSYEIKRKTFHLEQKDFNLIVNQINSDYGTTLNEVFISILGLTINHYCALPKYRIIIEETVYNSMSDSECKNGIVYQYPLSLNGERQSSECQYLRMTKEEIKRIPNNGLGYLLSLNLDNDSVVDVKELFNSSILYRYVKSPTVNICLSFKNLQYQGRYQPPSYV